MQVVAILPARMGSSRFPGKPLHPLSGMPMIGHCFHRVVLALGIKNTFVATCDQEIADYIHSIGGKSVMTSVDHTRATDRTAEAMLAIESVIGKKFDIVVMIQGDEPLIHPETISETLDHFNEKSVDIVNIMSRLRKREDFENKNNVKVVVNQLNDALYFSREAVPSQWKGDDGIPMYMQVGVIAFRREALLKFNNTSQTPLEIIESVDMNRVLETGGKIRMVLTEALTIGVDTSEDAVEAGDLLAADTIVARYSGL